MTGSVLSSCEALGMVACACGPGSCQVDQKVDAGCARPRLSQNPQASLHSEGSRISAAPGNAKETRQETCIFADIFLAHI